MSPRAILKRRENTSCFEVDVKDKTKQLCKIKQEREKETVCDARLSNRHHHHTHVPSTPPPRNCP